jgi:iron-regulated transporter 1
MKITIVVQRVSIIVGCVLWSLLFCSRTLRTDKEVLICLLIGLGITERICAVGNNLVMERDWTPTIAGEKTRPSLADVNAVMRRIDLVSKILAPVVVSAVRVRGGVGVLVGFTAAINLLTVGVELSTARTAWEQCQVLRVEREEAKDPGPGPDEDQEPATHRNGFLSSLRLYFSYHACLASLSSALQSFSVLSLSGPMTTYLLTRHYSLSLITTARTATSVVEIGSTLLFPYLATQLSIHRRPGSKLPDPMAILGLSAISLQFLLLTPCLLFLSSLPPPSPTEPGVITNPISRQALPFFTLLALSRLGLWVHNLAVQQIGQLRVDVGHRVEFSGVEMAMVSGAEIGRWGCAAIWGREGFWMLAGVGFGSVAVIWGLFFAWVVRQGRDIRGRK